MAKKEKAKRDVRQEVTDRLIQAMEEGSAPWQRPFEGGHRSAPVNAITGKEYRGGNHLWLALVQPSADPRWCTFNQAKAAGWSVKKGEHGVPIEVWKTYEKETTVDFSKRTEKEREAFQKAGISDGQQIKEDRRFAKIYIVFHASQIDGIPPLEIDPKKTHEFDLHAVGEKLFDRNEKSAEILFDAQGMAFYHISADRIHLPPRDQFLDAGHLYATAAHEIAHSTMHPSRLDREQYKEATDGKLKKDKSLLAKEELRAEIASFILSEKTGIPHHPENHESYVAGWVSLLKNNKNEIYQAARDAEKIADYVIQQQRLLDIAAPEQSVAQEILVSNSNEVKKEMEKQEKPEKRVHHDIILTHRKDLKERVDFETYDDPKIPDDELHYHPRQKVSGVLKDFSKSEFVLENEPEFGDIRVETWKRIFLDRESVLQEALGKHVEISFDDKGKNLTLAVHEKDGVRIEKDQYDMPPVPHGLMPTEHLHVKGKPKTLTGKLTHVHRDNVFEIEDAKKRPMLVSGVSPDRAHQAEIKKMIGHTVKITHGERLQVECPELQREAKKKKEVGLAR